MQTIAQISSVIALGNIASLSDAEFTQAHQTVQFAIDPAMLGEDPHLRQDVDNEGFSEESLIAMEQVLWAEARKREDAYIEKAWRSAPYRLPLAA